jgi:hypothetical protein
MERSDEVFVAIEGTIGINATIRSHFNGVNIIGNPRLNAG